MKGVVHVMICTALLLTMTACASEMGETPKPTIQPTEEGDMVGRHDRVEELMAMRDLDEIFALENDTDFAIALSSALNDWTGFGENLEVLSAEAQVFYLCDTLEMEVNNDGFVGFMFESYGQHAPATVGALETVGASKTADIVRRAIALLPDGICPKDYVERENILFTDFDGYSAAYNNLDDEFYSCPDGDLQALYVAYARENKNAFSAPL